MDDKVEAIVTAVKQSKKYRDTYEETIRVLAADALHRHRKHKPALKAVRQQLHSIMAPYLGDPKYEQAVEQLKVAFETNDAVQIKECCHSLLHDHLSTRERLPILEDFYTEIFRVTGQPKSIIDIACGLNPLAFPWMNLELPISFYAYDIHEPRIHFLNQYFVLQGLPQLAKLQDVAHHFPQEQADVALFLKELPRFERNYKGQGRPLLQALNARYIVLSFPTVSTHGGRNLTNRYREFMYQTIDGLDWQATELLFDGELVFCLKTDK